MKLPKKYSQRQGSMRPRPQRTKKERRRMRKPRARSSGAAITHLKPSHCSPDSIPPAPRYVYHTEQAGSFHISDTSSRPPVFDGCFKRGEEESMQGEILQLSDGDLVGRDERRGAWAGGDAGAHPAAATATPSFWRNQQLRLSPRRGRRRCHLSPRESKVWRTRVWAFGG